ncbi:MAG: FAD-dependent oxidoreductase [Oscillospiraceae bacterium]|nr:FAD-dependent oxidoreductase [Oscillospiraceae bacterium]
MNTQKQVKIAIIGGGASGLATAALLSKAGIKSTVIEKNPRVGKKLLATGNGRCNLGNNDLDLSNYHGDTDFAARIFRDWRGAERFFADFGLMCKADSSNRLYPYSNTANSVLDAFRLNCTHTDFLCDTEINSLNEVRTDIIVVACGGQSAFARNSAFGGRSASARNSAFGGVHLLKQSGHSIVTPFPSLCPIVTDKRLTRPLKGLRVFAECKAVANGKILRVETGEVQFNEDSLSGICIMNLSRLVKDYGDSLTISLDIAPDFTLEQLRDIPLTGLFHSRIVQVLKDKPLETVKDWRFPVTGVSDWTKSQVTAGGGPPPARKQHNMAKKR